MEHAGRNDEPGGAVLQMVAHDGSASATVGRGAGRRRGESCAAPEGLTSAGDPMSTCRTPRHGSATALAGTSSCADEFGRGDDFLNQLSRRLAEVLRTDAVRSKIAYDLGVSLVDAHSWLYATNLGRRLLIRWVS